MGSEDQVREEIKELEEILAAVAFSGQ